MSSWKVSGLVEDGVTYSALIFQLLAFSLNPQNASGESNSYCAAATNWLTNDCNGRRSQPSAGPAENTPAGTQVGKVIGDRVRENRISMMGICTVSAV
jgi:hypothetical protein